MNSKGQTLVVFILLLPILFLLLAIVIDLGNLELSKQKCQNEIKSTITYGLKNKDQDNIKEKMINMLDSNIEGEKNVIVSDTIVINIKQKQKSVFKNIIKNNYDIDMTYKGYIENNKIKIIKE